VVLMGFVGDGGLFVELLYVWCSLVDLLIMFVCWLWYRLWYKRVIRFVGRSFVLFVVCYEISIWCRCFCCCFVM